MPKLDTNAPKMPGHAARILSGRLRKIRSDTEIGTLEKRYDVNLPGRKDMEWANFKKRYNIETVKEALKLAQNQR